LFFIQWFGKEVVKVKPSILYFDDEIVLLSIFQEMFSDEYEVRIASTLSEASLILPKCPDIIISDWSMPEISGLDFLREAAEVCPDSFRIMLTGYGQVGDVFAEISSGLVQLFITKPWDEADMRETLERAILTRSRRKALRPRSGDSALAFITFIPVLTFCF
jgi:DNA-binding NtrC family response regulator